MNDYEINNRDLTCTELHLTDCDVTVEVDPFELMTNMIENLGLNPSDEKKVMSQLNKLRVTIEQMVG